MICPKPLRAGDVLGLICPSSPVYSPEKGQIDLAEKAVRELGFGVKRGENLFSSYGGYLAGEDRWRAEQINRMFADPAVDGILCLRGGYGAGRLVEYLDMELIKNHPKPLIGYSDVTVLHLLLNQQCQLITFHGPMAVSNMASGLDDYTRESFLSAVGGNPCCLYHPPAGQQIGILRPGKGAGRLVGGNLSVLCSSLGTKFELDTRGKILFLEEIGEEAGRLDRCFFQLRNAGKLREARGVLLGQFTGCYNQRRPQYGYLECFLDALGKRDIPVMCHIASGHGKRMATLPLGSWCRIDTEKRELSFSLL